MQGPQNLNRVPCKGSFKGSTGLVFARHFPVHIICFLFYMWVVVKIRVPFWVP